jgi:hypothetical protein
MLCVPFGAQIPPPMASAQGVPAAASLTSMAPMELSNLLTATARSQMAAEAKLDKVVSEGTAAVAALQAEYEAKIKNAKGKAKQTAAKTRDKAVAEASARLELETRQFQKYVEDAEKQSHAVSDELTKRASVAANVAPAVANAAPAAAANAAPTASSGVSKALSGAAPAGSDLAPAQPGFDSRALAAVLYEHLHGGSGDSLLKAEQHVRALSALFKARFGKDGDEFTSVWELMTMRVMILKGGMEDVMKVAAGLTIHPETMLALLHKIGAIHSLMASVTLPTGTSLPELLKVVEGSSSDEPKHSAQIAATHLSKLRNSVAQHLRKAFNAKQSHHLQMFVSWIDHLIRGATTRSIQLAADARTTLLADVAHADSWARACENLKQAVDVMLNCNAVKPSSIAEFCSEMIDQAEASNGTPAIPDMWSHKHENKVKRKVEAARILQSASEMQVERAHDESREARKRKEASSMPPPPPPPRTAGPQVCRDFQKPKGCNFKSCKFEHSCMGCKRKGHGESTCRAGRPAAPEQNESANGSGKLRKTSDPPTKSEVKAEDETTSG